MKEQYTDVRERLFELVWHLETMMSLNLSDHSTREQRHQGLVEAASLVRQIELTMRDEVPL